MTPLRRSLLAVALAACVLGLVLLVLRGPPLDSGGEDAVDRNEPSALEQARLRGHPSAGEATRPERADSGVVGGLVLDEKGAPAAGVVVRARREWEPYRRILLDLPDPREGSHAPPFEGSATSDADGRFRLEGLEERVRTWIWALPEPPWAPARALATPLRDRVPYVVLHLSRGASLRGRVVDVDGTGVAAWVDATQPFRREYTAQGQGDWCVWGLATDDEGRFEIPAAPDGEVWLSALVPGLGERSHVLVRTPVKEEVRIRLGAVPGATFEGRVRDTEGGPIAGAQISVRVRGRSVGHGYEEMWGRAARSAADGTWRVTNLYPGRVQEVRVRAAGFCEQCRDLYVLLRDGEVVPYDAVLVRTALVEGRVVDVAGKPIEGAEVRFLAAPLEPAIGSPLSRLVPWPTGPDGRYRAALAGGGMMKAYASYRRRFRLDPVLVVAREGAVVQAPDIVLEDVAIGTSPDAAGDATAARPAGSIEGRVVAPDGTPSPGLEVEARGPTDHRVVLAGTNGVFRIAGVAAGTWRLRARGPREVVVGEDVAVEVPADAVVRDVDVVTFAPRTLSGVVVDEGGDPVPGIQVGASHAGVARPCPGEVHAYADLEGNFTLTVYEDADWVLCLDHRTCPGVHASGSRGIRLVHRETAMRRAAVVVLGPEGETLLGALVSLRPSGQRIGWRPCQQGGGRYYVEVRAETTAVDVQVENAVDPRGQRLDVAPLEVQGLPLGDDPVVVRLERGRSLRVTVRDPDGVPVEGAAVRVGPDRAWSRRGTPTPLPTDADGVCVATGFPAGKDLLVVVTTRGPHANPPPLRVPPDSPRAEVRLLRATTVEGVVLDAAGRPLVGDVVNAALEGDSGKPWSGEGVQLEDPPYRGWVVRTDDAGRFRLERIPVGTTLRVTAPGGGSALPVTLPSVPAGAADLVLRASGGVEVGGRCTGAEAWLERADVRVALREDAAHGRSLASGRVGRDGAFHLGPVPAGRYRLVVTSLGTTLADLPVDAPAEDLSVALPPLCRLEIRAVDAEGFRVVVVGKGERPDGSTLDASGVAVFIFLDDRPRRVTVSRIGDERIGHVEAARPSQSPVTVTLRPGLTITGRITGAPPEKVAELQVVAGGQGILQRTRPGPDGAFRILGLLPGSYTIVVGHPGVPGEVATVEGVAAGREDVVLRFEPQ